MGSKARRRGGGGGGAKGSSKPLLSCACSTLLIHLTDNRQLQLQVQHACRQGCTPGWSMQDAPFFTMRQASHPALCAFLPINMCMCASLHTETAAHLACRPRTARTAPGAAPQHHSIPGAPDNGSHHTAAITARHHFVVAAAKQSQGSSKGAVTT